MPELFVYNSLSKTLDKFTPSEGNSVKIYICGPTVYDAPHIGHARTYISFDIIRRILKNYFKYNVTYVMNITNIDDKIIKRADEKGISCDELSQTYENMFLEEMDNLNVIRPDFVTRVTEYVPQIIKFIEDLEDNGYAYESNGSVYFDLNNYKKSFKYNLLRPECCKEEEQESSEKRSRDDFVLWKASKPGEPVYSSKWGNGRPGWHIECSAMASEIFGNNLDIHAGGVDLTFPHHENEIAQCQGCFKQQWVNYFLHTGHLNINGLKMSKSLKNFLTIKEIVKESSAQHLRILFLQHLWNKEMNYDKDQLTEAGSLLKKITNFVSNAESLTKVKNGRALNDFDKKMLKDLGNVKVELEEAICNNFNTPKALEILLNLISSTNNCIKTVHNCVLAMILDFVKEILEIFGVLKQTANAEESNEEKIAELLKDFRVEIRTALKSKADPKTLFTVCDKVRESIKGFGFTIDDTPEGSILRKN